MVAGVIDFDSEHLGRWPRLGTVKHIKFHQRFDQQRWINFCEREIRGGGNSEKEKWKGSKRERYIYICRSDGGRGFRHVPFHKILD